ncbi:MAG: rod shape-determining protein, partial [Candidatus Azambacteria bacterium]|nr:rod shape-determining protein [Candidatus Azambacteria bacterium]
AGGGSLLRGFPEMVEKATGIPTRLVDDPLTAVVRGCGIILEDVESLKEILVSNI